jgi:hypothetical protein
MGGSEERGFGRPPANYDTSRGATISSRRASCRLRSGAPRTCESVGATRSCLIAITAVARRKSVAVDHPPERLAINVENPRRGLLVVAGMSEDKLHVTPFDLSQLGPPMNLHDRV